MRQHFHHRKINMGILKTINLLEQHEYLSLQILTAIRNPPNKDNLILKGAKTSIKQQIWGQYPLESTVIGNLHHVQLSD